MADLRRLTAIIEREDTGYVALCPEYDVASEGVTIEEARRLAETEGVALNQFNNVAVAEKLSALRTDDYFRERAARGDVAKAKQILQRAGRRMPPVRGDELD